MKVSEDSWHYKLNSVLFGQELRQLKRNTYSNSCNYINLTLYSMFIVFLILVVLILIGFLGLTALQDFSNKYEMFKPIADLNIYALSIIGFIFATVSLLISLSVIICIVWLVAYGLPKLKNKIYSRDNDKDNIISQYIKNRKEKICSKLEFTKKDGK